jgi:L-malate glycosyltransferase
VKPLRVCHFASGDLWAGAEVQIATLLGELKRFPDLELSALLLNRGRLADELARRAIPVTVCDESRMGLARLLFAVIRYLKATRPHILHSHGYKEHTLGAVGGKLSNDPLTIQTYHGLQENLAGWAGLKMRIYDRLNLAVGRATADGAVGVSSEITSFLQDRYPSADVRCIRNGIDLDRIAVTVERDAMRAQLGIAPDAFVVGSVGRLMPVKGFEYLVEAFAQLPRKQTSPEHRLVIVGDGPLRDALGRCAGRHGVLRDVTFLGARSDVYDLMNAFDVFVLPSLHEGVPMVLLEAMAIGVPIVATHVGGIPEILEHDNDALLVPAKDPKALAQAIQLLAGSTALRAQLIRAARARAEGQRAIQFSAGATRDMYRSLCDSGNC